MPLGRSSRRPSFWGDRRGSLAIEYALICTLVLMGFMAALLTLSDTNNGGWKNLEDDINNGFSNV